MIYLLIGDDKESITLKRTPNLTKRRTEFKSAVDGDQDFRDEAHEDFEFYCGKQWNESTAMSLREQGRPVITDNRILSLINLLSGYQRMNRYDAKFLPRTSKDIDLCTVRDGLNRYIFDTSDYSEQESLMFLDGIICGRAWLEVIYKTDFSTLDGEAYIQRVSPFDIYPDPESKKPDYSDARFVCRAKWVDKDELKLVYPDEADYIEACTDQYDKDENTETINNEPLWYQKETRKIRMIEHWRKEIVQKQKYVLMNGEMINKEDIKPEHIAIGIKRPITLPEQQIVFTAFLGEVELEEKDSPYEHGEFPFVPYTVYYLGEGDIPAGVIRNTKDIQREINKRRSQAVNILNTQMNAGVMYESDAMSKSQRQNMAKIGTIPGAMLELSPGGLNKGRFVTPSPPPAGEIQSLQECVQARKDIAGINESLLGSDIPSGTSGRAIELRQKAAITHIGSLFDNQRRTKVQVLKLLWGNKNKKGIVQQYYTEEKSFRIVSDSGKQQFVSINQPQQQQDPMGNIINQTLNDMSVGEFDIVISDTPTNATQRISMFYSLSEAAAKLGIPGDIVFPLLIDLSDVPQKEEIKQKFLQKAEEQKQIANTPKQKEEPRVTESINIKDLFGQERIELLAQVGINSTGENLALTNQAQGQKTQHPIQSQAQPQQTQPQAQQTPSQPQTILLNILSNLPPEILQKMAGMDGKNLQNALTMISQQLPDQVKQQIAQEVQGVPINDLLNGIHQTIIKIVEEQGIGNQQQVPSQQRKQPQSSFMNPQAVQQQMPGQQPPTNQRHSSIYSNQQNADGMAGNRL